MRGQVPSASILDPGGVLPALLSSGFDESQFIGRGGVYAWSRWVRGAACTPCVLESARESPLSGVHTFIHQLGAHVVPL